MSTDQSERLAELERAVESLSNELYTERLRREAAEDERAGLSARLDVALSDRDAWRTRAERAEKEVKRLHDALDEARDALSGHVRFVVPRKT